MNENLVGIFFIVGMIASAISFAMQPDDKKTDEPDGLLDQLLNKTRTREDKDK